MESKYFRLRYKIWCLLVQPRRRIYSGYHARARGHTARTGHCTVQPVLDTVQFSPYWTL